MNAVLTLWLPILLSAVVVFVISSLVHMVFKWHASDYSAFSNEDAVRTAIRAGNPSPGRYVLPYCSEMKEMSSEAMQKKYRDGPVGHFTLALRDIATQEDTARFNDIDPVTWVYNRRYMGEAIEAELIRCGRYAKILSLVVLDLDDFGHFNSNYGQSMGDKLLRSAAVSLAEAVSPPEIVARIGPDEYAVLLPETNRAAAVQVTTRLLASLSQVSIFGADGSAEPLKASVAIVCFPEDGASAKDLLDSATGDLEQAKRERDEQARADAVKGVNPLARAAGERIRG